jgi:hypothetical protein
MATIIARSAESVHWYNKNGSPQYTVKAKDGSNRPTTLRDARKMGLVPSVTTVLKVSAKPALEAWKLEQMLLAALTLPRIEGENEKSLIARIVADSKESAKAAAERGTRIHESIEKHYKKEAVDPEHEKLVWAFEETVFNHFKTHPHQTWHTEVAFASEMGYGGKIDLYAPQGLGVPDGIVLDAKSKAFSPDDDVKGYEEHGMKLAAYRMGLGLPYARCANVFVSVTHPNLIKVVEWSEEDLKRFWLMFNSLLDYWELKHQFGGSEND